MILRSGALTQALLSSKMKRGALLSLLLLLWLTPAPAPLAAADQSARVPVVVELFTSEGCSSCPPADALLRELEARQPIASVEVIPLGFHVDYWDELGWKDRFSSAAYTHRQEEYAARFGLQSAYTPQVVVDGRVEMVGNDRDRVLEAVARRAAAPRARIEAQRVGDQLEVRVSGAERGAEVLLALTETDLSTSVGGGENNGRQLRHTGVVRSLRRLGSIQGAVFETRVPLAPQKDWRMANLRAVVFVQQPRNSEIAGAISLKLQ